jgi:hypothetical protein
VSSKDFLSDNADYQAVRDKLLRGLLLEATRQAVGTVVRGRTSFVSEQVNDTFSEKLLDQMVEKVQGRITSYHVDKEETLAIEGSTERILQMEVSATVCVPDPNSIPEVVAVGSVTDEKGDALAERKAFLEGAMPDSPRVVVADGDPNVVYHDGLLKGRVVLARAEVVDNRQKKALLAQYLAKGAVNQVADQVLQVTVTSAADLVRTLDGEVTTATVTYRKDLAVGADPAPLINRLIDESLAEAAQRVMTNFANSL